MKVTLLSFQAHSPLLEACADIYARTWGRSYAEAHWTFSEYAGFPHFQAVVARRGSEDVGFALGTQSRDGQWWHNCVAQQMGSAHPALQQAFVLTELAVLPLYRNLGIGALLHDALLDQQPMPNALLSTMAANVAARRFYQRLGWRTLHPGFVFFEGQEAYTILCKKLCADLSTASSGQ